MKNQNGFLFMMCSIDDMLARLAQDRVYIKSYRILSIRSKSPRTEIETPQTSVWWAAHLTLVSWRSFPSELDVAIPVDAAREGRARCRTTSGGIPLPGLH
jgi:hypothetical protein